MSTQITATELQKKITGYLETLALETDLARKSEAMQKYLDFVSRFHQYSPSNIFLILFARPDATQVAGFETWKKMGRFVRKGERGIPILAPMVRKEDPDDDNSPKILTGFKVVYVFDVAQTDGQLLPPIPNWKSPERNEELNRRLINFAESRGIIVTFKDLPGETQGVSRGGAIEISPQAGTVTLVHEVAHELLHRGNDRPKDRRILEGEAEAVAYVVARYFEINNLQCSIYLGLNDIEAIDLFSLIRNIQKPINEIIDWVENKEEV